MYPVSDRFKDAMGGSHRAISKAVLLNDRQLGSAPTGGLELPILSGDVKMTSTADIKNTLDLTVPGDYWDDVQPYGAELYVWRGVDFGDGTSELVPLGYFRIQDVEQDNAPHGPVRISGQDRVADIMQNRVLYPLTIAAGTTHRMLFQRLINGKQLSGAANGPINLEGYAILGGVETPIIWTAYDPDNARLGSDATIDGEDDYSTYTFLSKLVDDRDCVLRFDEAGNLLVDSRDRDPATPPDYAVQKGVTGTLISASRKTTRDGVYNIISAYGSDSASPTGYKLAYNMNSNSPIWTFGAFWAAPLFYSSPLLKTADQAQAAAETLLARYTGLPNTVSLIAVPNPAMRPLDVISANFAGLPEAHVVDEVTIPLGGSDPVQIACRTADEVFKTTSTTTTQAPTVDPATASPPQVLVDQEKCFEISCKAETNFEAWWSRFDFVFALGDYLGYVYGICAFSTATGQAFDVVNNYTLAKPGNVLAPFLPNLQACLNVGKSASAAATAAAQLGPAFDAAWQTAAQDPVFQAVQIRYRDRVLWAPAYQQAMADGLSLLGVAIYFDTYCNHHQGNPSSNDYSFEDIRSRTTGTLPANGGSEATWLTNFLAVRNAALVALGDSRSNGAVSMFTTLKGTGNFSLTTPFDYTVYGATTTMGDDPTPYLWGATGYGANTFPNVAKVLNIGALPGQNSFCVDVGFNGSEGPDFARYGSNCHTFSRDEIEDGLNVTRYFEANTAGTSALITAYPDGGKLVATDTYSAVGMRETERDGSRMAFNPSTGQHYVQGATRVDWLSPVKPSIIIAQMRDTRGETASITLTNATTVVAKLLGNTVATLDAAYVVQFTKNWKLEVTASGTVNYYWNDLETPAYSAPFALSGTRTGQHFRVGAYLQWNTTDGDNSPARIRMTNLVHWHSQTPQSPNPWPEPTVGGIVIPGSTGGAGTEDDGVEAAKLLSWGNVIDGDEFAYSGAPDESKWDVFDGDAANGHGDYDPDLLTVDGGVLTCIGDSSANSGGMAFVRNEKYCRVEWRIRAYSVNPLGGGRHYQPALTMWPSSEAFPRGGKYHFYGGECDRGRHEAFLYEPSDDANLFEYISRNCDLSQWHNLAFEWSAQGIKGWLDGRQLFEYRGRYILAPGPMHATLSLDASRDRGMEPARLEARWFRVYQKPS